MTRQAQDSCLVNVVRRQKNFSFCHIQNKQKLNGTTRLFREFQNINPENILGLGLMFLFNRSCDLTNLQLAAY